MVGNRRTYIVPRQDTVGKLQPAGDDEEDHKDINEFRALRRRLLVVLKDIEGDLINLARRVARRPCRRRG